jgi:hypothetical protein
MVIIRAAFDGTNVVKVLSAMKKSNNHNYKSPIKAQEMAGIFGIVAIMILISMQLRHQRPLKPADPIDVNHLDPRTAKMAELIGAQLVPGESVGKIRLGDSEESVISLVGSPQMGDAAMCKSWSRWEWGEPLHVLEIFASCDPKRNMEKTVQQIRFSGIPFETAGGISPKSTFAKIRQEFNGLIAVATFKDKATGQQRIIVDQTKRGIAFVVDAKDQQPDPQGKCHSIIIHPPGKKAIDTYLQPEWDLHPLG